MIYGIEPNIGPCADNRSPLTTDPPLPWQTCYHPTIARTAVQVMYDGDKPNTRRRGNCSLDPIDQMLALENGCRHDRIYYAHLERKMAEQATNTEGGVPRQVADKAPSNAPPTSQSLKAKVVQLMYSCPPLNDTNLNMTADDPGRTYEDYLCEGPVINVSLDLESLPPQEMNPWMFFAQIDQLKK